MKMYEIIDRDTGMGFSMFDNHAHYTPVWKKKAKQCKSYPSARDVLYQLLNEHHVKSASILQTELKKVGEWPFLDLKAGTASMAGADKIVVFDKTSKKYFSTRYGFDTTLVGANYYTDLQKAEASISRKIDVLKENVIKAQKLLAQYSCLRSTEGAAHVERASRDLARFEDQSNWVVVGFANVQSWLPQSVAKKLQDGEWW